MAEWIRVKDRLPDPTINPEVLTYSPNKKYESCFQAALFDGEDFWFDGNGCPIYGITHWMTLQTPTDHFPDAGKKVE